MALIQGLVREQETLMARQLTWLSDAEWAKIEPLLPQGRKGARRVDDRRVISGIVHMLKIGARWRDCPPEYGPYTTIYNRFHRWSQQGVWFEVFEALTGYSGVWGSSAIDSTSIRDCQDFRVWPGIMGNKESHYVTTQRTCHTE
ncbi:hypothetical protein CG471_27150 [Sphingobium sp. IP1]|nr:hypothetical protein CG471_27150 [Sphingobium sp. IP1]